MPPKPPPPALSAPGLIGPISILNQPISGPRSNRRTRNRPYSHARLEVDLRPPDPDPRPAANPAGDAAKDRGLLSSLDLVGLAGATLHAFAARRFRRIDHWELDEGSWLPLPVRGSGSRAPEPVGQLLAALESIDAGVASAANRFAARLSSLDGGRADLQLKPGKRGGRGALLIDLYGSWDREALDGLSTALSARLPIAGIRLVKFRYE